MIQLKLVKIGLYARVSSEKQSQEKTINSQIESIIEFANSVGEKIDPDLYFIDDGVSGAHLQRPGLDKLRDKALSGDVTKIYVLSPDRLSRKSAHQILLIEEMKRLGVNFSFTNRQIDDTPEDQLLLQVQGIIAEYEREKILERSRRGKIYAAKKGKVSILGGAPYGYYYKKATDTQDAAYLIHPEEAPVVKEAFNLYCYNDFTIRKIAEHFTSQAYITRKGKPAWRHSVISGMLRNPAYKGKAAFRKTKKIEHPPKKIKNTLNSDRVSKKFHSIRARSEDDWIYISVPAIITEREFDIAQQKLKENIKFASRNKKYNYLLSGLLRCKTCGHAIFGMARVSGKCKKLYYYYCPGQNSFRNPEGRVCSGHSVRVEAIDELVWQSIKELLLTPEIITEEYKRRLNCTATDYEAIIDQKNSEIARYKRERERLIDLFQSGIVEKNEIDAKLKGINSKVEHLNNEINYVLNQQNESKKLLTVIRGLDDFSFNMKKNLDSHTIEEKRKIIKLLVEEVEVDTINQEIKVKHIIPLDIKNGRLCTNTPYAGLTCS